MAAGASNMPTLGISGGGGTAGYNTGRLSAFLIPPLTTDH
jgi:hypothetical protein